MLAKENQLAETTAECKIGAGLMSANMNCQRSSRQQL
jgi:hypothetical protein